MRKVAIFLLVICGCAPEVKTDNPKPFACDSDQLVDVFGECYDRPANCTPVMLHQDADLDGFGNNDVTTDGCFELSLPGWTLDDNDCDDFDRYSYPGAPELCDGADNDCDNELPLDEIDADMDSFMTCEGDCNDLEAGINPGATEWCQDDFDSDCDGLAGPTEIGCTPGPLNQQVEAIWTISWSPGTHVDIDPGTTTVMGTVILRSYVGDSNVTRVTARILVKDDPSQGGVYEWGQDGALEAADAISYCQLIQSWSGAVLGTSSPNSFGDLDFSTNILVEEFVG